MINRPSHILFTAYDPWDNIKLCSAKLVYECRKSASGYYREYAKQIARAAKSGCSEIIQSREPLITTELVYYQ